MNDTQKAHFVEFARHLLKTNRELSTGVLVASFVNAGNLVDRHEFTEQAREWLQGEEDLVHDAATDVFAVKRS